MRLSRDGRKKMPHKRKGPSFDDHFTCPKCGASNQIYRYADSAGKMTRSLCRKCRKDVKVMAGRPKVRKEAKKKADFLK